MISDDLDAVYGYGGDDYINVSNINDWVGIQLYGGSGNDMLVGDIHEHLSYLNEGTAIPTETEGAYLYGESGNDRIAGTLRNDVADGGYDHDDIRVLLGDDTVYGGPGNDFVDSGQGADILAGESGADRLLGGAGTDYLVGGDGSDWLYGDTNEGVVAAWDGDAERRVPYLNEVNYSLGPVNSGIVEWYYLADAPVTEVGDDVLIGGRGDDWLYGGGASDYLYGGGDQDVLQGEAGDDHLFGGDGDDWLWGDKWDESVEADGGVIDQYTYPSALVMFRWREHQDGVDVAGNDVMDGGAGIDVLYAGGGDDTLNGGIGNDWLYGGAGDDQYIVDAAWGIDVIDDEDGSDAIVFKSVVPADLFIGRTGDGIRFSDWTGENQVVVNGGLGRGGAGIDTILGGVGDDTIRLHNFTRNKIVEIIDGGVGVNVIAGTRANNTIDLSGTTVRNIDHIDAGEYIGRKFTIDRIAIMNQHTGFILERIFGRLGDGNHAPPKKTL